MALGPRLETETPGSVIESSVSSMITGNRIPEIIGMLFVDAIILLSVVAHSGQISIAERGDKFIAYNRLDGRPACEVLAPVSMMRGVVDDRSEEHTSELQS